MYKLRLSIHGDEYKKLSGIKVQGDMPSYILWPRFYLISKYRSSLILDWSKQMILTDKGKKKKKMKKM